jgi:hypothetical protein
VRTQIDGKVTLITAAARGPDRSHPLPVAGGINVE